MNNPPISIKINESGDRIDVWDSSGHPDNLETKNVLRGLGYIVQTLGEVYTITGGADLVGIKTGLERVYGVVQDDRSSFNQNTGENQ